MKKINILAYRFGKGAEIHDCSEAPAQIYTSMQDILFGQNRFFSWQETIPTGFSFPANDTTTTPNSQRINNKALVVDAVTSLAKHVALSLLTDNTTTMIIGGDHTQAIGASKGLVLAETVHAILNGRLRLASSGNAWIHLLQNAVERSDIIAIAKQVETLVYHCIAPQELQQFLTSFYVIWFDAHGDFNTEETTLSGNAHGMSAAVICGEGNPALTGILGAWIKIPPPNIHFVAVRDLDREEETLMRTKCVPIYPMELIRQKGLAEVMQQVMHTIQNDALHTGHPPIIHLSFDIDGIDAKYVPATGTPVGEGSTRNQARGPSLEETVTAFWGIAEDVALIDLAESNFSPKRDPHGTTLHSVSRIITSFFAEQPAHLRQFATFPKQ